MTILLWARFVFLMALVTLVVLYIRAEFLSRE
jgi:hypothetical protein